MKRQGRLGVATLVVLSLVAGRTVASDPPPQDSFDAVVDEVTRAIGNVRKLGPVLGLDTTTVDASACDIVAPGPCADLDVAPCEQVLRDLFDRLASLARGSEPVRAGAAQYLAAAVAGAALRLGVARDAIAAGRCDDAALPGTHPSRLVVSGDLRTLVVEPSRPLRVGRSYAVGVEGLPAAEMAALRGDVVPVSSRDGCVGLPPGALNALAAPVLAADAGGLRVDETRAFLETLEGDARTLPGLAAFSGARLRLASPLTSERLRTLRAYFAPRGRPPRGATVATYHVLDPRPGLAAYRGAIGRLDCSVGPAVARTLDEFRLKPGGHVAEVFRGEYASLDITGGSGVAGLLGVPPAEARAVSLPFVLAVPRDVDPSAPLVIGLNGHSGRASDWLSAHADAIVAHGMPFLAIELPAHGERHVEGKEFLDPLVPSSLALDFRQAVVDVMAAVRLARHCGIALPDGRRLAPREARYMGYSLGGMVGAVTHTVEPDLGPTALVAPAGDMTSWMMLRIAVTLGSEFVACVGGEGNGQGCLKTPCPPPGMCVEHIALSRLKSLVELPYRLVLGGSDPLGFVGQPGEAGSRAPVLIVTGGNDEVLSPLLATRLADAWRLHSTGEGRRHRAGVTLVQWPDFHHNIATQPEARNQVYAFLARGRLRSAH